MGVSSEGPYFKLQRYKKWDPHEAHMAVSSEGPYFEPFIIYIKMEWYQYKME